MSHFVMTCSMDACTKKHFEKWNETFEGRSATVLFSMVMTCTMDEKRQDNISRCPVDRIFEV
jgi:hypothetical protein